MAKSCVAELDRQLHGRAAQAVQKVVAANPHLQGQRSRLAQIVPDLYPELAPEVVSLFDAVNAFLRARRY